MRIQKPDPRTAVLWVIVLAAAALRLFTSFAEHSNSWLALTPLGAMALFGGAYFTGPLRPMLFSLLPLFISDVILCFTVYAPFREGLLYDGWYWVYGSFALMTLCGQLIITRTSLVRLAMAVLAATCIHWLVGNLAACLAAGAPAGFASSYIQRLAEGLGYELKFLASTVLYSLLMFGSFELMQKKFSRLPANRSMLPS